MSAKSSIDLVKKGAKVPSKAIPPVGILHHASDWAVFPVHIVSLNYDLTVFSNNLREIILNELTSWRKYGIL